MFTDGRSKRIVFVAHCLLNQNAISDGTAVFPAAFADVISLLLDAQVGIVQLPCPELSCLGLDRGNPAGAGEEVVRENTRIRRAMEQPQQMERLRRLVESVMGQIREYHRHGFQILGIIGANRSPNCGVNSTSDQNQELAGKGLFMEALSAALEKENIDVPLIGIKASEDYMAKIQGLLEGKKGVAP